MGRGEGGGGRKVDGEEMMGMKVEARKEMGEGRRWRRGGDGGDVEEGRKWGDNKVWCGKV